MKKLVLCLFTFAAAMLLPLAVQAQVNGSIAGTVVDQAGAVVPGATVTVKGEGGQEFTATTTGSGVYNIPAVPAGFYTVTISAANFKTSIVQNVKVDVATPATVDAALTAGAISETVIVTSGAEVLQTQTATVGTNIQGRQILETPIQSRDALDLVTLLPGANSVGNVRTTSINGLPKSAMTIQIDGVDVQDNFLKSSDGFFTFIRPRIDAIDEVTVSTSNPGSEASGDGAVGIRFATRRGTDDYKGTAFWQHRDESLNATNFENNFRGLPKSKLRLNQFGASFGGPLPFLNFGETDDWWASGKGTSYFFVNYERFHLNENSPARTRTVLTGDARNGIFRYGPNGVNSVNLYTIAGAAGLVNTPDPTVSSVLNTISAATATTGTFGLLGADNTFFRQTYSFVNPGTQRRRFLVTRFDFNLTKDHALDIVYNDQPFRSNVDFLNNADPNFPGIANAGTQNSDRRSLSIGLRSNFGSNVVNQFRYAQLSGWLGGSSDFFLVGGEEFFEQNQRGFQLGLGSGLTGLAVRNSFSSRSSPTRDFTDNVTWVKGNHTFTFGGQLKKIETLSDSVNPIRSTISFGYLGDLVDPQLRDAISLSTIPGATTAELANARALYSTLTGRVSGYTSTVRLAGDGRYVLNGNRHFEIEEETNGIFAQDSWRIRPNLTISGGVRWQPQMGAKLNTTNYAILTNPDMAWDISGPGNVFSPGTVDLSLSPTFRQNELGERAFRNDLNNFAPSVGVVWSPNFKGWFGKMFGRDGASVIRGGFSRAFIREGTLIVENSLGLNPGGSFGNSRSATTTNPNTLLTPGTLFRTPGNPNLVAPAFNEVPVFPRAVDPNNDNTFGFSDDFHSGYVDSWSIGYQREIDRDTVVEFRYVGNRGRDMQLQYNHNEVNAIENGWGAEFALAQQNLLANIAAGRGANFRYFGAGTGTSPLPILVSYFSGNSVNPALTASYSSTLYANATFLNSLNPANPNPIGMANTLDFNFRANTLTAGTFQPAKAANFVHNCPTTFGFCYIFDNSERSWYDAGVIEVRRRLSDGLRFQASYTYAKSFSNAYASAGDPFFGSGAGDQSNNGVITQRNRDLDRTYSQIDVRHAFKFDATWDLPFGKGRSYMSSSNWFSNALFGGWSIVPTIRWQSGSPVLMENINLVGMTAGELQKAVGVYYNQTINGVVVPVSYLPQDIIENTIKAFTFATPSATNVTGYPVGRAPTGRFISPAGYGNCQQRSLGECGYRKFILYGPDFFKMDTAIIKRVQFDEKRNIEFRVTVFDVLNKTNWRIGGWGGNGTNVTTFTGTFGQLGTGSSYSDPNGSNDPGGRLIDFLMRFNF
jgi:hypothetical protein